MPAIPTNVMERLHQATEQFSAACRRTDGLDNMDPKERAELAAVLRAAQKELDDVGREIAMILSLSSSSSEALK